MSDYRVEPRQNSDRFVVVNKEGKVVEDAQGWGYKSRGAAEKAMWYHFGGGKKKIDSNKEEAKKFWASHKEAAKEFNDLFESWVKEICRGEVAEKEIIEEVCKKYSIEDIPVKYFDYL
jgi:hypothetical protein